MTIARTMLPVVLTLGYQGLQLWEDDPGSQESKHQRISKLLTSGAWEMLT